MSVTISPVPPPVLPRLAPDASQAVPTLRAYYSDRTAALMAAMCEFAYALPAERAAVAAELARGGFRLAAVTRRAFLATSSRMAVLAWRGTACAADWRLDLSARRVPLPDAPGLRVHAGFLAGFQEDEAAVEAAVAAHLTPGVPLYIAGHSLGGALAQIAAAVLRSDDVAACYTFGSPRVGTSLFDGRVKTPHWRVVNDWDLVPGVPAPFVRGYLHSGDPRLLTPGASCALRRDRAPLARLAVDVAAGAAALVTRRLPVVEDHAIAAYRVELERIALACADDHAAHAA